jgi:hypothetical protein
MVRRQLLVGNRPLRVITILMGTGPQEMGVVSMATGVVRLVTALLPFDALPIARGSWYLIRML